MEPAQRVLKSVMSARLAGVLEGAQSLNHFKTWKLRYDEPTLEFGFFAAEVGAEFVGAPGEVTRQAGKAKRSAIFRRAQAQKDGKG